MSGESKAEELLRKSARWSRDEEYLACVQDILDNKVFQSMDQFIPPGQQLPLKLLQHPGAKEQHHGGPMGGQGGDAP